jgi:methylated-DNA-[protein]-cysteine S-methyltransferase
MTDAFTTFATPVGVCAVAWGPGGITGVQLPEQDERATRARMRRRFASARPDAPAPPAVEAAVGAMQALLRGEPVDLTTIEVELGDVDDVARRVYGVARTIPSGATTTYGEIADRIGEPALTREVGRALAGNPVPIIVPCHRVLAARGRIGGFSANGGITMKLRLLAIEGALLTGAR